MFARVSTFNGPPDHIDGLAREAEEVVIPTASRLGGFRGLLVLGDRASGRALSITLWDTEQAMAASEQAADRLRRDTATTGGRQIAGVEHFEVFVDQPS